MSALHLVIPLIVVVVFSFIMYGAYVSVSESFNTIVEAHHTAIQKATQ